jgi:hypothetical protein
MEIPTAAVILDRDSGTTYTPFINKHWEVGYRCEGVDGEVTYVYLNPSGGSDDGVATVFLYQGSTGDHDQDGPTVHVVVWEQDR